VRVATQIDRLLLGRAGAEVEPVVVPDRRQWSDVRPAVDAHGRDPVQLGGLEDAEGLRPGSRRRVRITEADVLLSYGFHANADCHGGRNSPVAPLHAADRVGDVTDGWFRDPRKRRNLGWGRRSGRDGLRDASRDANWRQPQQERKPQDDRL
jgi:hypothetical protein